MPLFASSVTTWLRESYLSSVLSAMSVAFEEAQARRPAILFIDECDAIGRRQSHDRDFGEYWNALVNRMLELLDGAVRTEGVIVVGATNRPDRIDEALTRSGRWETQVTIPMPDRAALTGILAHHLGRGLPQIIATAPPGGGGGTPLAGSTHPYEHSSGRSASVPKSQPAPLPTLAAAGGPSVAAAGVGAATGTGATTPTAATKVPAPAYNTDEGGRP